MTPLHESDFIATNDVADAGGFLREGVLKSVLVPGKSPAEVRGKSCSVVVYRMSTRSRGTASETSILLVRPRSHNLQTGEL